MNDEIRIQHLLPIAYVIHYIRYFYDINIDIFFIERIILVLNKYNFKIYFYKQLI
jgi:hypothetical protein